MKSLELLGFLMVLISVGVSANSGDETKSVSSANEDAETVMAQATDAKGQAAIDQQAAAISAALEAQLEARLEDSAASVILRDRLTVGAN
ncbi:hypothetical protein [Parahalioglobus pacificus]|uniref:Uncharacterized protein n=1 Tax=Parahalioglobus pacificus TaxID=930806 RepID=A0A918XK46_9GAMM|nr:hypothetical protein [Halioglobus pacificus]NQY02966.1 hypothetical protein [Halieaceae bacterium]GHD34555.1 hypothetical protein GCM10007053_20460 [Halioglobus pacificus]